MRKKYWLFFIFLLLFTANQKEVLAAVVPGSIDETGEITGIIGATYYNVSTWQDMFDTYAQVTPDATSNDTVYLNVIGDVPGSAAFTRNDGTRIIAGKSLVILGNGYTLYADNDTNYTTSPGGAGGSSIKGGFSSRNLAIPNSTILSVENASIVNNVTGGIFQAVNANGANASTKNAPTFVYKNVRVRNGAPRNGAQPIRNDQGKILFYGENTFDIMENHNFFNDSAPWGSDNQGEWIQGGHWVEIVDGTTTVNQSWSWDQPFYTYGNNSSTLKINDNAHLRWNLNYTYTMYYDDRNGGPLVWEIGDNASFVINGTQRTASEYSRGWFMNTDFTSWDLLVGKNSKLLISTGGGTINMGREAFNGGHVRWWADENSEILLNNLNRNSNLFQGNPGGTSGITLKNPKVFTLNTVGGAVFPTGITNFPIQIIGGGLRTHASTTAATFDSTFDLVTPNSKNLASNDIWYRQNMGRISNLGSASVNAQLTPNNYTSTDMNAINRAYYFSLYQPLGYWLDLESSQMNRSFEVKLEDLPLDSSFSSLIDAKDKKKLVVGDDRGQAPNIHITVTLLENYLENGLEYYWDDKITQTKLETNIAAKIASLTDDKNLPSFVTMQGAGMSYSLDFPEDLGLKIKATNRLLAQENAKAGIFQYSVNDGPG